MFSRRSFITGATMASVAVGANRAAAADACTVIGADLQRATTPEAAVQMLKEGNARFVAGKSMNCNLLEQVKATSKGQFPIAAIVGCIDSRVPPELVFDQQLGDIFAARIAGNFVNDDIIGSLEFATKVAGAKAIVVLGHSECGAIKGGIDKAQLGLLTKMLENFDSAIQANAAMEGEKTSKNKKLVQAVADTNATMAAKKLVERSEVLKSLVEEKQLIIAAAMHDISTGKVSFFS